MKGSFLLDPCRELRTGERDDIDDMPMDMLFTDGMTYDNGRQCRLLVSAREDWGWVTLTLEIDGHGPTPKSALACELDAIGPIEEVLDIRDVETFLLQQGIAPGQPFWLWVNIEYYQSGWEYPEWDADVDYAVTSVVPWSRERAAEAWEAFYGRRAMMVF